MASVRVALPVFRRDGDSYSTSGFIGAMLRAEGLNIVPQADKREFTVHTISLWIDAEH